MKPELLIKDIMTLGEGPVWDDRRQRLYWVDIPEGRLWHWEQASGETGSVKAGDSLGMCALAEDEGLVLALWQDIELLQGQERRTLVRNAEPDKPDNRFNDGKVDPMGRLLVGTMGTKGKREQGALYSLGGAEGKLRRLLDGVSTSNGLGWSLDGRRLYYVDTPTGFLWGFDYDLDTGDISNRQPLIDYRPEAGNFDGICMDAEGCVWAAHWGGWQVSRWDPETGRKLLSIAVPAPYVTSCCFGGPDLKTLFITSAWNRSEETRAQAPLAGSLFAVQTPYQGLPPHRFRA